MHSSLPRDARNNKKRYKFTNLLRVFVQKTQTRLSTHSNGFLSFRTLQIFQKKSQKVSSQACRVRWKITVGPTQAFVDGIANFSLEFFVFFF
jgi:hypothetical protein